MKWAAGFFVGVLIAAVTNHIVMWWICKYQGGMSCGYAICSSIPIAVIAGVVGWIVAAWLLGKEI